MYSTATYYEPVSPSPSLRNSEPPTQQHNVAPPFADAWFYLPWEVLQTVLESLRRPAVVLDATGRVILQNDAATQRVRANPDAMRIFRDETGRPWAAGAFVLNAHASQLGGCSILVWEPTRVSSADVAINCAQRWNLTKRQAQVLSLLVEGKCNKAIAEALRCAVRTVELHVSAVLEKSGCDARTRLVACAWQGMATAQL
jgi:DNA-binding CsgD family transcriptional regulator